MKKIQTYLIPLLAVTFLLSACEDTNEPDLNPEEQGVALCFAPNVEDMDSQPVTRATNIFFANNDKISIDITDSKEEAKAESYSYTYNQEKGTFSGEDGKGFFFSLDNTYVKELIANWPTTTIQKQSVILDQRLQQNFKQADHLQAKIEDHNIMPTSEPIPLNFKHKQSRFSFRIAGQNANGLTIKDLILELQYDDPKTENETNVSGAFWAYCHDNIAELILLPEMEIKAPRKTSGSDEIDEGKLVNNRYMIGRITVGGNKPYTGGIWLHKDTKVTLESGKDYVVTLTPEGYNLIASIEVHGFGQGEGHIGIPVNYPISKSEGIYEVTVISQLVTLSHLLLGSIKEQSDKSLWQRYTYQINPEIIMTKDWKRVYKSIDPGLKNNFKNATNETAPIENIKDENNEAGFPLFKE